MSSPTQAEVETQISNVVRILDNFRIYAGVTGSTNFLDNLDTFTQSLETSYAAEATAAMQGFRSSLVSAINGGGGMIAPLLSQMAQVIDCPETGTQEIITRLYDYMVDNSQAVTSRGFTYGSVTMGGGNVGTGTIKRLTTDADGYDIENATPEVKVANCIRDAHSGAIRNEEVFQFLGSDANRDNLLISGSGAVSTINAVSARNSLPGNPSWTLYSGTTSVPTALSDWTVGSNIANFEIDTTNYYRDDPGDGGTPASLKIKADDSVTQAWTVRNITLRPNTPYYCAVAYNRQVGAGDGTLTLTCGDQTASVVLSAQTGWNLLEITQGVKSWLKTMNATTPVMKVELASRTTGSVLVDDLIFAPYVAFDGLWYLPLGGATPFLRDDTGTWTDSATEAILQRWFWQALGRYLPHATGGSVTWADPT